MKTIILGLTALMTLSGAAAAAPVTKSFQVAQVELHIGDGDRGREGVVVRERDGDRDRDRDRRRFYRERDRCHMVEIRERRGPDVIIRRVRRCD